MRHGCKLRGAERHSRVGGSVSAAPGNVSDPQAPRGTRPLRPPRPSSQQAHDQLLKQPVATHGNQSLQSGHGKVHGETMELLNPRPKRVRAEDPNPTWKRASSEGLMWAMVSLA